MAARMMLKLVMALLAAPLAAASLPDPTVLPKALSSPGPENEAVEPALAWVKVNGKRSIAWYGGSTVKLGDTVEGGRVTAIREDHIVISGKNGRRSVYLLDESTRTQLLAPSRPARKIRK
jgi:hypothetical protein